jgi:hypothetical protein
MALKKLKGQNFRVFVNGSAVPEASSCQVTTTGNMEDSKTKDSEGSFGMEQMTSRSWSVQVDSYEATAASLIAVIQQFVSDEKVQVGWDETREEAGSKNRTPNNAAFARSGLAILNDFTIVANNRTSIQVTRQYMGAGALA